MNINPDELFYKDNKLFSFSAKVVKCVPHDGYFGIVLDKTGFFPEAGGQKADKGTINSLSVYDAQVTNEGIEHYLKVPLEVGSVAVCRIDENDRLTKERNHTGEHIVSSVVHKKFGYDNVGFHMGKIKMDVDFNGEFTQEDLSYIEREANRIVMENVAVKTYFPTTEELEKIEYRSKLELTNPRIVEIEGYDYCACCAPHVSFTGEVGTIKITDSCRNRGNTRLTLLCQSDAFDYVQTVCTDARRAGALLNVKPFSVSGAVERQLEENASLKRENTYLKRTITDSFVDSLRQTDEFLIVFCPSFAAKDVLNKGLELSKKGVFVFSETTDGYLYSLASKTVDMRVFSQELNKLFSGAGGGRPNAVQGKVRASKSQLEDFVKQKTKE